MKKTLKNRFVSAVLSISVLFSLTGIAAFTASAFDKEYISEDGMQLGYSIVNGYTKLSIKNNPHQNSGRIAVYSGVDISNPYVITMGGIYVLSHNIDIDKFLSDNDYAMSLIEKFDSYMKNVGIKNEKSKNFLQSVSDKNLKFDKKLDTAGIYIFDASDEYAKELMENNEYVDFVLAGGNVPSNMKDLNSDGKTDLKDAELIQSYLAQSFDLDDDDEEAYALFAADYNKDKEINISDVTDLQKDFFNHKLS